MTLHMLLNVVVLGVLLVIGIFDVREHRIPNMYVLLVLIFAVLMKLADGTSGIRFMAIFQDIAAGMLFFLFGFVLFLLKAMAPGDVKLLGSVGFFLGLNDALTGAFYIALSMVIIGLFYYFYFRAQTYHPSVLSLAKNYFSHSELSSLSLVVFFRQYYGVGQQKPEGMVTNRMPFAPVIVLGVSLFQYYGG